MKGSISEEGNNNKDDDDNSITDPEDESCPYKDIKEEAEDREVPETYPKEEERVGMVGGITTIMKTAIGTGILNLPLICKILGVIPSIMFLASTMVINILSTWFLMKCKQYTKRYGYLIYAKISFGIPGSIVCRCILPFRTFGVCCVYLRIFGNLFKQIVTLVVPDNGEFYFQNNFYVFVVFFLLFPLMFKSDIMALKRFSFIGVLSLFIFEGSLLILFIHKLRNNEIGPITPDMLWLNKKTKFLDLYVSYTALFYSFCYQISIFPVYHSLKPRNTKYMVKTVTVSMVLTAIVYFITGMIGFLMYRDKIDNVILDNFKEDLDVYRKTNKFITAVLFICIIAYFIQALLTMPICYVNMKQGLMTLISFIKKMMNKKNKSDGKEGQELLEEGEQPKEEQKNEDNFKLNIIITIVSYIFVLLFTLCVDKIIVINNIVGATVSNYIIMIGPALYILRISPKGTLNQEKCLGFVILFIGLITFITFFITKIMPV